MNIDNLLIPARIASLFVKIMDTERTDIEPNKGSFFVINENLMQDVLTALGAKNELELPKNEQIPLENELLEVKNEQIEPVVTLFDDNQSINTNLPQGLVEVIEKKRF